MGGASVKMEGQGFISLIRKVIIKKGGKEVRRTLLT